MDTAQQKYGQSTMEITPEATEKSPCINLQRERKGIRYEALALGDPLGI
jgi:hypothetical protein